MTAHYDPRDEQGNVTADILDAADAADQADHYASLRARTGTFRVPWPVPEVDPFEAEERAMGGWG